MSARGVLAHLMVFFGVWWAWTNFTWLASGEYAVSALLLVAIVAVLETAARRRGAIAESMRTI